MIKSNLRIIFRTDASLQMGTGHVMRCLTLATALKQQGAAVTFICRDHTGNLIEKIQQTGFTVHKLTTINKPVTNKQPSEKKQLFHAAWLGTTQEQDALDCQSILEELQLDWLVVDHYALDKHWQQALKPYYKKLMVIDDLADRQHGCDLLLDQTFGRDSDDYKPFVPEHCQVLCGTEYALLRPEFAQWRAYSLKRREKGQLEHLLINLGGVDKDNITTLILKALSSASLPENCQITVVMGATAPWVKAVEQQAALMPWPTEVKVGVNNMAELMANSDLAIGAAGATSWERCCLGLPTIMVVLAENQKLAAEALEKINAALKLSYDQEFSLALSEHFDSLLSDTSLLSKMSQSAQNVSDGLGAKVLINKLINHEVQYA